MLPPSDPRRAYEEAVLAALDFEPSHDRSARGRGRSRLAFTALLVTHVVVSVLFAELLAAGRGGSLLVIVAIAWLAGITCIVRTTLHAAFRSVPNCG